MRFCPTIYKKFAQNSSIWLTRIGGRYVFAPDPLKSWVFMGSDLVRWGVVYSPPWVCTKSRLQNGFQTEKECVFEPKMIEFMAILILRTLLADD